VADEPKSEPQAGLAKAVRFLRNELGLTQATLAEKSAIPVVDVAAIEDGEADPSWATMRKVAQGLRVPLESLADLAERFEEAAMVRPVRADLSHLDSTSSS